MKKIARNLVLTLGSLIIASIPIPVISCSNWNQNVQKLSISGGTDKIFIDQSNGENINGWYHINFNVSYQNKQLTNDDIKWELVDCKTSKIKIYGEYIVWNNPEKENFNFKLKANYFNEETKCNIEGLSQSIEFMGDPNICKIEFANKDLSAHQITCIDSISGLQESPWFLKINGEEYKGLHEQFNLIDKDGNQVEGIYFNSKNQIVWNDTLKAGTEQFYIKTTIVDSVKKISYSVVSSNNPIKFIIDRRQLTIEGNKTSGYVPARKEGTFSSYKLVNHDNVDITSSSTTFWRLENVGSTEFGNNISISNGRVQYSNELKPGNYTFRILADDAISGHQVSSSNLNLICYEVLTVKGGRTTFDILQGSKGYDSNPWRLTSGESALLADNFEIVSVIPEEKERIEELKQHVKLNDSPLNSSIEKTFLIWDSSVPYGNYRFQIKAIYKDTEILSDVIKFNVHDKTTKFIYFDHNIKRISAIKSGNKLFMTSSQKNELPQSTGQCNNRISVYFCTGQKLRIGDIKFTYAGVEGVDFSIDDQGILHWSNINNADDTKLLPVNLLTITATYDYGSFTLTANTTIEFSIEKLYDQNVLKVMDEAHSFRDKISGDSMQPVYFPKRRDKQYYLSRDNISTPYKKATLELNNDGLIELAMFDSKSRSYYAARHFEKIAFTFLVPAHTKIEYTVIAKSNLYLYSNWHPVPVDVKGQFEIFTFQNPDDLPTSLPEKELVSRKYNYDDSKRKYTGDEPEEHFWTEWKFTLTNESSVDRYMNIYYGFGISMKQGGKVMGPDLGTRLVATFNVESIAINQ